MQHILITGGTGTLGRHVLPRLQDRGYKVRVLTRQTRVADEGVEYVTGDLSTGEGVAAAVAGAEIVVHCAGSGTGDEVKAHTLVQAAAQADVRHLIYISVVGAERIPVVSGIDRAMFAYFASKRAAERVIADSGIPWTTLRATQFHDLLLLVAQQMVKLPVVPFPAGFRFQPIEAEEVAVRLVELALNTPAGMVDDMAGPKIYSTSDLLRSYLRASRRSRLIVPLWLPGAAARAIRGGANLAPAHAVGRRTWEQFLAERGREFDERPTTNADHRPPTTDHRR